MNELEIAEAIAAGRLPSPTVFCNAAFYALRISGTGAAWREGHDEFCWREPAIWLSDTMQTRCRGLLVTIQHPAKGMLDRESFIGSVVGAIIFSWVRDQELWGVARVLDGDAAALLDSGAFDTSPAAIFAPNTNETVTLSDGEKLLVEGSPMLLDHLAIVPAGAWGAGRELESGVELTLEGKEAA